MNRSSKNESVSDKINSFVKKNSEYVLLEVGIVKNDQPTFLIGKKKDLIVTTLWEANIFQPLEATEEKTFLICFILSFAKKKIPSSFKKYVEMGCDIVFSSKEETLEDIQIRCSKI